jgi:hypothetical protein
VAAEAAPSRICMSIRKNKKNKRKSQLNHRVQMHQIMISKWSMAAANDA